MLLTPNKNVVRPYHIQMPPDIFFSFFLEWIILNQSNFCYSTSVPFFFYIYSLFFFFSIMAATLEQKSSFAIPKLAQDLIAGTIGGWAQVVVGKGQTCHVTALVIDLSFFLSLQAILSIPSKYDYKHNLRHPSTRMLWIASISLSSQKG